MTILNYIIMFIGFGMWFYAGYKIGCAKTTKKWVRKITELVKSPETEISVDKEKITYKFNVPFSEKSSLK